MPPVAAPATIAAPSGCATSARASDTGGRAAAIRPSCVVDDPTPSERPVERARGGELREQDRVVAGDVRRPARREQAPVGTLHERLERRARAARRRRAAELHERTALAGEARIEPAGRGQARDERAVAAIAGAGAPGDEDPAVGQQRQRAGRGRRVPHGRAEAELQQREAVAPEGGIRDAGRAEAGDDDLLAGHVVVVGDADVAGDDDLSGSARARSRRVPCRRAARAPPTGTPRRVRRRARGRAA